MKTKTELARALIHPVLAIERRCAFGRRPEDVHGVLCNKLTDAVAFSLADDRPCKHDFCAKYPHLAEERHALEAENVIPAEAVRADVAALWAERTRLAMAYLRKRGDDGNGYCPSCRWLIVVCEDARVGCDGKDARAALKALEGGT